MDTMECINAINNNNCDKCSQDWQWHEKMKDPNLNVNIDHFWFDGLCDHRAVAWRS